MSSADNMRNRRYEATWFQRSCDRSCHARPEISEPQLTLVLIRIRIYSTSLSPAHGKQIQDEIKMLYEEWLIEIGLQGIIPTVFFSRTRCILACRLPIIRCWCGGFVRLPIGSKRFQLRNWGVARDSRRLQPLASEERWDWKQFLIKTIRRDITVE